MSASKIVSLNQFRKVKEVEKEDPVYRAKIDGMEKLDLLEEMVRFQEERTRVGELTPEMMIRGKVLFRALENHAETDELRLLTGSYRRHLEFELDAYLKKDNA